jgi:hypothetical protein
VRAGPVELRQVEIQTQTVQPDQIVAAEQVAQAGSMRSPERAHRDKRAVQALRLRITGLAAVARG